MKDEINKIAYSNSLDINEKKIAMEIMAYSEKEECKKGESDGRKEHS